MRNLKKSKKEKAETRREQNRRALEKKRMAGLVRVSLWIPAEVLEKCQSLERVGLVFSKDRDFVSVVAGSEGFSEVGYRPSLLE